MESKEIEKVRLREMIHEIYVIGQEGKSIKTEDFIVEIKKKLNQIFNESH